METTRTLDTGVEVSFGPIIIDNVGPGLNPKKHRAQIRQEVTKKYPAIRTHDSLSDALFAIEDFSVQMDANTFIEKRVTWVDIPVGATIEQVKAKLDAIPGARLVRYLSLNPIISAEQEGAITKGLNSLTLEKVAANQVVMNAQDEKNLEPVYYRDTLQYRVIKFKTTPEADVDTRDIEFKAIRAAGIAMPFQMANPVAVLAEVENKRIEAVKAGDPLQMANPSPETIATTGSLELETQK